MDLKDVLQFTRKMIDTVGGVPAHLFRPDEDQWNSIDLYLRKMLDPDFDYEGYFGKYMMNMEEKVFYLLLDNFSIYYSFLKLPQESNSTYMIIGPYLIEKPDEMFYTKVIAQNQLTDNTMTALKNFYSVLPIGDHAKVISAFNILVSFLYSKEEECRIEFLEDQKRQPILESFVPDPDMYFSIHLIKERYDKENELLNAVKKGNQEAAVIAYHDFLSFQIAPRDKDPLRDRKNLSFVLNTLLRKACETSFVHPVYLDEVSRQYALKIESAISTKQLENLNLEMIRKYCILVKNKSLRNHSPIIRKTVDYINLNLSSPLGLKDLANLFNVNHSYLSTLFKKEIGETLTDYVNKQRINAALKLLNTGYMQVQDIAYYVGISDVNYFSKLFKKQVGDTPSGYWKKIQKTDPPK
ncbi:MAG TPA: helix-turn-helix domain-containing protein [Candidatus Merdenecus merdavium]|nr:helix-turn-helix domain-containing protein [Candidatus Merdenecus merdavium]